ncbi:MAG: CZB domain-containing protein, partial [Sedimentisphaerales bacterium]|nr:CZB domain-containing protein [Sedimentisphaerales bacterium]
MFKNLTIGKKLALGFAAVLILLVLVGAISFWGVTNLGVGAQDVVAKNELVDNLTRKEIDHLNWANQVTALLTDDNVTELNVQTDDHKCAFGQWLYSDARKHAEQQVPELASVLKEIEGYHHSLHTSAIDIGKHYKQADAALPGILAARMVDHLKWADAIRDAFLGNLNSVEVQTNPDKCALGQWLTTEQAKKSYEHGSVEFKKAWDEMLITHKKLHESAIEICDSIGQQQQGREQAMKVFNDKTLPLLKETLSSLESMKTAADNALAGSKKAGEIFATQTKPNLHKVQELLDGACKHVNSIVDETNKGMLASASSTKFSVSILSIIAVVLGIVAAIFIARGISSALKRIINALREGAEQVAAASGQVSAASQSLAEGATEQAAGLEETSSSLEEMAS